MSALPERRRRRTLAMFATTVLVLLAVPFIGYVGARAVLDSTGGRDAQAGDLPTQAFPSTPSAMALTVDDDGDLAGVTVFVLAQSGVGGSIISVPVNSDVGFSPDSRRSLQQVYAEGGVDEMVFAIESLVLVSVNFVAELGPDETAGFLLPYEPFTVTLTHDVVIEGDDGDDDETISKGTVVLDAANAAQVLTAGAGEGDENVRRGNLDAFWVGLAEAVGTGRPTTQQLEYSPGSFDDLVARLFAAPVQSRGIGVYELVGDENPDDLDVVQLDRSEAVFIFAAIAPGSMSAPAAGPVIRLEAPAGYDLEVKLTIDKLLFLATNVVSVDTTAAPRADTVFLVPDEANRTRAQTTDVIFGDIVFENPSVRIEGIDVTIVLGTDYLESVET